MRNCLLLFILILLLFAGCKKHSDTGCVENLLGTKSFTAEEKLIQPYLLNDSLVFYNDSLNDQYTFSCKSCQDYYIRYGSNGFFDPWYQGCLGDYYKLEYVEVQFGVQSVNHLYISETCPVPNDTTYTEKGLQVYIQLTTSGFEDFRGVYAFQKDTLFNYPHNTYSRVDQFIDTITISNKLYHKVYLLEGSMDSPFFETINKVYYTIKDGVLRFSTTKNNVWDLREKFTGSLKCRVR
jgi:hypothetical protein